MGKALLVIDIQNDYFKNGAMELVGAKEAAMVANKLINSFRENNLPVIFIQHIADHKSTFFVPGTKGVEIHSSIQPTESELVVQKKFPNSFRETNLDEILHKRSIDELIVCGMMTHMCVDTTVRAASDLGYDITLIADACATKNLTFNSSTATSDFVQTSYLAALDGTFAEVVDYDNFKI